MDVLNSVILTILGISYTLGSIILSEIGNIDKFASPTKLLRYAMLRASGLIIWNSETYNAYCNRKLTQGKSHNNVICHVTHKLTRIIYIYSICLKKTLNSKNN